MKSSARNIQMTYYEELFEMGGSEGTARETVKEIAPAELLPGEKAYACLKSMLAVFFH